MNASTHILVCVTGCAFFVIFLISCENFWFSSKFRNSLLVKNLGRSDIDDEEVKKVYIAQSHERKKVVQYTNGIDDFIYSFVSFHSFSVVLYYT